MKKVLILDLDNTIYPAPSIARQLFEPVFKMIDDSGEFGEKAEDIKNDMMKIPFQKVAESYKFSSDLTNKITNKLSELTYDGDIKPFDDFEYVKQLPAVKYLATTGFRKMQESKIKLLGLYEVFEEIYIVDPQETPDKTKRHIFEEILRKYNYRKDELLVVGDDEDSEIKAAHEIGVDAIVYDHEQKIRDSISNFGQLRQYFIM